MQVKGLAAAGESISKVQLTWDSTALLTWLVFVLCDTEDLKWADDIHRIKSIVEAEQDLIRLSNGQKQWKAEGMKWSKTDLDVRDGVTILLHDCTHLAGIVLRK